jgi:hypothetical protein
MQSHSVHVTTTTEKQTVAFNIQARINFKSRRRARMGIWEAMEMLNTLVDESDPDVSSRDFDYKWTRLMRLCSPRCTDQLVADRTSTPNR